MLPRCWIHSMNLCFQLFFLTCQRSFIAVDNIYWVCWTGPASERIIEWACEVHRNTFPVTGKTEADPKTALVSGWSLQWDQQVFCVKKLTSEKVTIAWTNCSHLHLIEVSAHETFSFQKQKGLVTRMCIRAGILLTTCTSVCTNCFGRQGRWRGTPHSSCT